ncbi:MAG: hypothetical protein HKL90_02515 [Elusimicrobia bacterium]|nr:hypothetical protein [Elusimicrobiota bacterium]
MNAAPARLLALLLTASSARALDARLAAVSDPESGDAPGLTLSAGTGRVECARATFSRATAEAGGAVYVVDAGAPGDEDAIRLSAAVLARSAGPASPAAALARRHGVPAVALGRGLWDASGPSWTLELTTFGPARTEGGFSIRPAGPPLERVLREGDAVCVDADAGRASFPPSEEAEARLAAAEAARAYDGLRDAGALERWLRGAPDTARAAFLMAELTPRSLAGVVPAADLARLDYAARAAAGAAGAPRVARAESRAWSRALARARARAAACPASAADAPSQDVLDRLTRGARDEAARAAAAGRALGLGDGGLGALSRRCAAVAAARRGRVPASAPTLDAAVLAAGARRPPAVELGSEAWRAFSAGSLAAFLSDTADDASLSLREKSARARARILAAPLDAASVAGRALSSAAGAGPCVISGADGSAAVADATAAPAAAKSVWAASWDPGPLRARLRAGRGADQDGRLRVERALAADASGVIFTRDPSSLRPGRALIEAASGGPDAALSASSTRLWTVDLADGRAVSAPASAAPLSAERLKSLARLARALDAWQGGAVEAAFAFAGPNLYVLHARPLSPPPEPLPKTDASAAPAPETLNVKAVR